MYVCQNVSRRFLTVVCILHHLTLMCPHDSGCPMDVLAIVRHTLLFGGIFLLSLCPFVSSLLFGSRFPLPGSQLLPPLLSLLRFIRREQLQFSGSSRNQALLEDAASTFSLALRLPLHLPRGVSLSHSSGGSQISGVTRAPLPCILQPTACQVSPLPYQTNGKGSPGGRTTVGRWPLDRAAPTRLQQTGFLFDNEVVLLDMKGGAGRERSCLLIRSRCEASTRRC